MIHEYTWQHIVPANSILAKYSKKRGEKAILIPKEDWVVTPGTHEAIVSEEVFTQAQKGFRTRKEITLPDKPRSIFVGLLKCTHCNKSIVFESRYRRRFYCHAFNMGIGCEQAKIDEQPLIDTIFAVIKTKLELVQASEQAVMAERQIRTDKRDAERNECEAKLKKLKLSQSNALEQFLEGHFSKESYQIQKNRISAAIMETTYQLAELDNQTENASDFIESHKPYFGQETLTREMLQGLIKEIRVTSAEEMEIVWKFGEMYFDLQSWFML